MREKRAALVRVIAETRRCVRKTLTKEAAPTAIRERMGRCPLLLLWDSMYAMS